MNKSINDDIKNNIEKESSETKPTLREKRTAAVMEKTGWSAEKAYKAYRRAYTKYGVNFATYMQYRFYDIPQNKHGDYITKINQENETGVGIYAPMTTRLNLTLEEFETSKLSNLSNQAALEPNYPIEEPRYSYNPETREYSSYLIPGDGIADIMLAGDLMCRFEQQDAAMKKYGKFDFSDMFPHMKQIFEKSDFVVGNLESVISEAAKYTYEMNSNDGELNRNAPSTMLDAVRGAGFDMVVTANNHCLDGGITGIYQTINHLKQYGLINTGLFLDKSDRAENKGILVDIDGIKVGFVSYAQGSNGRAANIMTKDAKKYLLNIYREKKAIKDIADLKKAGAEYVIAYIHWGTQYSHGINDTQLEWAQGLADAGADFIAGSHPHVTEPFKYITNSGGKKIPVIFSMGNFISSMENPERRDSVVINLKLEKIDGKVNVKDLSFIPCYTCKKYGDLDYTTVPLNAEFCKDNSELIESRERTAYIVGDEIKESEYTSDATGFSSGKKLNISLKDEKVERIKAKLMFITGWDRKTLNAELSRIRKKYKLGLEKYYEGEYFRLDDAGIEEKLNATKLQKEERMERMMKESGWTRKQIEAHMQHARKNYVYGAVDYEVLKCWEMSDEELDTCSTLYTTRAISKKFNTAEGHRIAKNKIEFNKVFKDYIQRKFWINEQDATYESFLEFIDGLDYIFSKPVNLQAGKGAQKHKVADYDPKELYESFMARPLVLVEECVKQCRELNELYDNSVNTIRLITVNTGEECKVIASFFRIGANGSVVDNMASGGLIAGVDEKTGVVVTGALDSKGELFYNHPNTGTRIKGFQLPRFDEACDLVLKAIKHIPSLKYVGWDVAVCDDKMVIIEGNTYPDLGAYQLPFWRDYNKSGMKYKFEEYL